ncbi:nucleotidyltransferase domain-containing protein [Candidatus Woesearchaeota archaeon]|nr:nucleotidyltransferase domain-containing protein [Candidatus Woesearchaeota archaeon]
MIKDLEKFKVKLKRSIQIDKLILFGSRARGDHFLDSDVDLLIVSKAFKGSSMSERIAEILKFWDGEVDIEPICYTPEEFRKKKDQIGIVQQAVKEGKELAVS